MIRFSREKVLLLHQLLAEETGGSVGLRDQTLLESTPLPRFFNHPELVVIDLREK